MDTQFLESFLLVVEHGSVAEAARRLSLTPAGVTQRLKALEAELGMALVSRSGRTVRPTEAGWSILPQVQTLLAGCATCAPSPAKRPLPEGWRWARYPVR